jgi:hypothetical protein
MTLSLTVVGDAAGVSLDTTAIGIGTGWHIQLRTNPAIGGGVGVVGIAVTFNLEPKGIFTNLCDPTHWGVDRTTATGGLNVILQSHIYTMANVAGAHARTAPSAQRFQGVVDQMMQRSQDNEPDIVPVMSILARSIFVGVLTANAQWNTDEGSGKKNNDLGPDGSSLMALGKKIRVSHHWPRGLVMFLNRKTWFTWNYKPDQFIRDENGNVYRLLQGTANMGGLWQSFGNFFTPEPQKNALVCGMTV